LRRDHEFLKPIRRRFPDELQKLSEASLLADGVAAASWWASCHSAPSPKNRSKKRYERKRGRYARNGFGEIEREFGDARPTLSALSPDDAAYAPFCLDHTFKGGAVNMQRLQELFGMDRHRFPKQLPFCKNGRETLYDYRAVIKIMDALLNERPGKTRKKPRRGRTRLTWLNNPNLRNRVLTGIEMRINSFPVKEEIKSAFVSVVPRHSPDSGKK
jgi:hypothetical protein